MVFLCDDQLLISPPLRGGRTPWRPGGASRSVEQQTYRFNLGGLRSISPDLEIASNFMGNFARIHRCRCQVKDRLTSDASPTRPLPRPTSPKGGETARTRFFDTVVVPPDYPEKPKLARFGAYERERAGRPLFRDQSLPIVGKHLRLRKSSPGEHPPPPVSSKDHT